MNYDIEIQEVPETRYAAVEITCGPAEFETEVEQALTQVWSVMDDAGILPAGPPFCLVPQIQGLDDEVPPPTPWKLITGFPIEEDVVAEDPILVGVLPGGRALTTVHLGKLESLSTAYLALQVHMEANGLSPAGPPWEEYHTDPAWEPDASKWRTIVRWPLA